LTHLGWSVLLVAPNDIGFGKAFEAQFVNLDVGTEGDEADEGVFGEEV
jgi:hypothetical protein